MDYSRNPIPPPPVYQTPSYYTPKNPWYKPVRRNSNIVGAGLLALTLLSLFLYPAFEAFEYFFVESLEIRSPELLSLLEQIRGLTLYLLMFIVPLTVMRLWIGIPPHVAFPMRKPRATLLFPAVLFCLGVAIIGIFASATVSGLVKLIFGLEQIRVPAVHPVGAAATAVYFVQVTFAPAFLEELMFRGVIMQSLRRFGDAFAILFSSVLFAFIHLNMEQGVSVFFIGLAIAYFVIRTGSLITGMVIHFTHNAILTVFELYSRNFSEIAQNLMSLALLAVYTVLGLTGFALLQHFHGGSFKLKRSGYPVTEGKKYLIAFTSPVMLIHVAAAMVIILIQLK